jgi:hypothetical protein
VHTLLCNAVGHGQLVHTFQQMSGSLATISYWMCLSSVKRASACHTSSAVNMLGVYSLCAYICLTTVESNATYLHFFPWYYTINLHQLAVDFQWCNTHHTQNSKHISHFKVSHGSSRPSIFKLTVQWCDIQCPLTAVQRHNLHVPITCLNLLSDDMVSCQTCCYLIFLDLLMYLPEAENSKYGKGHIHNRVQQGWIKIWHSFWTIIMPLT